MYHLLLTLSLLRKGCLCTTAESEANIANVVSKDDLMKIVTEMSIEIKKISLEHLVFLQMRKELDWTHGELQRMKEENLITKGAVDELVLVKQELLETKEKLQTLQDELEITKDIQTNILITQRENTRIINGLDYRTTTSEEHIRKVFNCIKTNRPWKWGCPDNSKDTPDREYSNNIKSDETVQVKRVVKDFLGSGESDRGVKRSSVVPKVAFMAGISSTLSGIIGRGQAVVFDNVQLNIGNGYDKYSGIFHAPVAGLYLVFVTISTDYSSGPDVTVVRNGSKLCATIPSALDLTYAGSPCNVVVQLMQGDAIWVQEYTYRATDKIRNDMWSTFSVALLSADGSASS